MMKFKELFIKAVSDIKGNVSSRRLTAFWFTVLATLINVACIVMINKSGVNDYIIKHIDVLMNILIIDCSMILLLFGVIVVQDIINLRNSLKLGAPPDKPKDENEEIL